MPKPAILTISDQTNYKHKRTAVDQQGRQEWIVDVGTLYPRNVINELFLKSSALPQEYDARPDFPGQYAMEIDFEQVDKAPNLWRYSCLWRTITNLQEAIADPAKRPVLIDVGTYKYQKTPNIDNDGKPVCTTAGEPINHTIQRGAATFFFQKNYKEFPTQFGKDRDFVNQDNVSILGMTFKPYELFMPEVTVSHLQFEGNYPYYAFTGTVYVNTEEFGWKTRLRNAGYHERKEISKTRTRVLIDPSNPFGGSYIKEVTTYGLEAIKMGTPGRYVYPSSPIVLDPDGRAFRQVTDADRALYQYNRFSIFRTAKQRKEAKLIATGPILGLHVPGEPVESSGITDDQWKEAVVEVNFFNVVDFNTLLPLK